MEKPHWPMGLATAVSEWGWKAMAAMGDFPMENMGSFLGGKPRTQWSFLGKSSQKLAITYQWKQL